jgi:MFS family permease
MLGLFMVMPVLAVLSVDYPDYSPVWVGLAIGAYGLSQAVLQIPMGMWSDRFGRKPIIIIGLLLFAAGSLVAAVADNMLWLTVGRFLQGMGAIAGAVMALAADITRENQRSKVMAIIGIAIGFSFYLSLILGPIIASNAGLQGIFIVTAMLAIGCIPLVQFVVPKVHTSAPGGDTLPDLADIGDMLNSGQLLKLNISVLLLHMMITLIFVQFPTLLANFGWQLDEHWIIYLPVLIVAILGMGFLMGFGRRYALNKVLIFSLFLMANSFILMSLSSESFVLLMAAICLFFIAFNYLEANLPALVANVSAPGKKGSAMGIYASFQFFGAFLGGIVSGLLMTTFGSEVVWILAAVICLAWTWLFRNLDGAQRLKRYTLSLNPAGRDIATIQSEFKQLQGISEFTIVPDESAVYLKVAGNDFDIIKARKVADPG